MTKSILIKAVIEGSGIVNFDSNDQKYLWNQQKNVEHVNPRYKNTSFGKGRYYSYTENKNDEEVKYLAKVPVISADCIRHAMFEDVMPMMLPNIMHDDNLLLQTIANPCMIERGYLFMRDGKTTWKRKSPFMIGYAKGTSTSTPALETYSNTQPKTGEDKSEDTPETSYFKREVRGDTTYELSGVIDIGELGFISVSEIHDRLSFDSDYSAKYREFLAQRINSEVSEPAFYLKNGDIYNIPEQGIHLTKEQVRYLVEDILTRLARMSITRAVTGFAKTKSISIKFVNDPLEDTITNPDGWIDIFNGKLDLSSLDNCGFDSVYTKTDLVEEAKNTIEQYRKKFGYVKKEKAKKKTEKTEEE